MTGLLRRLEALNAAIDRAAARIAIVAVAAMFLVVVAQVFFRYVLNASLVWAEEAARYLLVLTTFLGASVAMRRGAQMRITAFLGLLAPGPLRAVELVAQSTACLVYAVLVWYGAALARENFTQASPAMRIPLGWVYLMIPAAGVLLALQALERIAGLLLAVAPAASAVPADTRD